MTGRNKDNTTVIAHVVMKLGERTYACDACHVQEIIGCPDVEPCLDGTGFLIGEYRSSRGNLPVLDLLGRPPDLCPIRRMSLVTLEISNQLISLLVDDLHEIVEFSHEVVCPLPEGANGVPGALLKGVASINERDYYLLDPYQIVMAWLGDMFEHHAGAGDNVQDR